MANHKNKLWSGVFTRPTDPLMEQFNASVHFDRELYAEDITGSTAYARALKKAGVISARELKRIEKGLALIRHKLETGQLRFTAADEDIHMGIEKRLAVYIGETAAKLHTGRSRNEQVVLDERLYVKKAIQRMDKHLVQLAKALLKKAAGNLGVIMPGYTHLQQGQLVRFSHYLAALCWMLERDRERLADCRKRCDVMPLGSGALAGNSLKLDRAFLARQLGMAAVSPNSMDAVSDRDFLVEFLSVCAIVGMHLSRFCEDLIVWSSREFGFIVLDDQYATGSSLMPQKKNPDSLELVRGKSGRLYGHLVALLTVLKGLPLTYAKDLQEDKEPLFDTVATLDQAVSVFTGAVSSLKVVKKDLSRWVDSSIYATDLVDHLVAKGVPFRTAHQQVGALIRSGTFAEELARAGIADPVRSVERKNSDGGTSLASVKKQLAALRQKLKKTGDRR